MQALEHFGFDYHLLGHETISPVQYRARKQAADLWDDRLLTRAVLHQSRLFWFK